METNCIELKTTSPGVRSGTHNWRNTPNANVCPLLQVMLRTLIKYYYYYYKCQWSEIMGCTCIMDASWRLSLVWLGKTKNSVFGFCCCSYCMHMYVLYYSKYMYHKQIPSLSNKACNKLYNRPFIIIIIIFNNNIIYIYIIIITIIIINRIPTILDNLGILFSQFIT